MIDALAFLFWLFLAFWALSFLFKSVVLWSLYSIFIGRQKAKERYGCNLFILFLVVIPFIYTMGNIIGFSWKRLEFVSEKELVDTAIRYVYPGKYANAEDLKKDYSKFELHANYNLEEDTGYGSPFHISTFYIDKLFGFSIYRVTLPNDIFVSLDVDGVAHFADTYPCAEDCPVVTVPDRPEKGVVGFIHKDKKNPDSEGEFSIEWEGKNKGEVLVVDRCFAAYINTPSQYLKITEKGAGSIDVGHYYDFYLIAIDGPVSSHIRISKEEFLKSKSCSEEARKNWQNLGGGNIFRED